MDGSDGELSWSLSLIGCALAAVWLADLNLVKVETGTWLVAVRFPWIFPYIRPDTWSPLLLFTAKSQPFSACLWRQLHFLSTQHLLDSSLIPYRPDHDSKSLTLHKAFMTHSDHSRTCGLRPILAPTSYLLKCSSYVFLGRPGPRGSVHVCTKSVRPHPKFAHSTIYPQSYF